MGSETELDATYNFFNNPKVDVQSLLYPHITATAQRLQTWGGEDSVVIHDTTEMEYGGPRRDLGPLSGKRRGFLAHVALAATFRPQQMPVGVLGLHLLTRPEKPVPEPKELRKTKKPEKQKRLKLTSGRRAKYSLDLKENENALWEHGIVDAEGRLSKDAPRPVHVYDRGGDSYLQHVQNVERQRRIVTRLTHDRALFRQEDGPRHISEALLNRPVLAERDIFISTRAPKERPDENRKHPPRKERSAHVVITSVKVLIARPHGAPATLPKFVPLNLVHVIEPKPPAGCTPVEWTLATTEPVETAADVERVIDLYRSRWLIEEFFKALKSGCAVLSREFEEAAALQNVLALSIPLAVQMLALRAAARINEATPATLVLSELQAELLVAAAEKLPPRQRPPSNPTVRQALLAIAALGGHLKRNGEPGWMTLARGLHKLHEMEAYFRIYEKLHSPGVKRSPGS
jgi:hypothetical protein